MPEVSPPQSLSALLAHGLLLTGAGAAIFLAGGAPQGNLGVFLLCAGVALVACPPRVRVEWRLWAAAAGLVFCGALAFLPARWVAVPHWRQVIASVPAVILPTSITPAPGETAFWLALLALTLVIGLFALSQPVRARGMSWLVLAAVAACAVYAGLAMYAKITGWHYPFSGEATFGFLPNRNHSATLLITGSVLAMGLMSVAFRDRRWVVADAAVAGGLVCVVALCFFSESRAGVLILPVGGLVWLAGLGGRHRPGKLLVVVAAVAVVAGGLFFGFKSPARDRVLDMAGIKVGGGGGKPTPRPTPTPEAAAAGGGVAAPDAGGKPVDPPSEFRVPIYRDTLALIRDQPWTGSGLGTFAGVFAQYRRESLVQFNAVHPESDWLMLIAEAGWPAFGCVVVLIGLAAGRLAGLGEHPYWPLRWGCAAAAGAAVLHSAVDVPAHRAALGWWVLAIAGLALQRQGAESGGSAVRTGARSFNAETRREEEGRRGRSKEEGSGGGGAWQRRVQRGVFVLAGVGALVLGGLLVRGEWFKGPALPPFAAEAAPQRMFDDYQRKAYAQGMDLARRTRRDSPLTASAYYYLGAFLAVSDEEGIDQQVDEMFQAERVLDPVMPDVPRHQAMAWVGYDPARQTAMTMEELGRMGRIDRALARGFQMDLPYYGSLVAQAAAQPDVQRYLLAVTRPDPRFGAEWARWAGRELVQGWVERQAADAAWMQEGGRVRPDWYLQPESAGPASPVQAGGVGIGAATEWASGAWPVRLRQMVYAGQYRQAVEAVEARYGLALAGAGTSEGEGGSGEEEPEAVEMRRQAAQAARDGRWKDAWLALERYVRHTRQTEWP